MQKMGLNEIREQYLSFFESKGHLRLPSFSLVPKDDPSILLINAGMTPLKPYFTGARKPPRQRVTTCQKCIRTPDIDSVGYTARHGTFFEMLGNFSFGDYFKQDAIPWAWEFSTEVLKLDPERISVTVYQDDDEAFELWEKSVGLPPERIHRMGKEDNFWEHGIGPCGPCSELFYDRGEAYGCGQPDCGVGCECDRYIEYWNLVFTQFDRQEDGTYLPLKKKNIDTGAGLERIACIMQGVDNLFEVDTVRGVLDKVCDLARIHYGDDHKADVGIRVITDHLRSGTMMVSDGIRPSNEGRGYVLRRLLRRALRYGRMLGIQTDFLPIVAREVIQRSASAYPELAERSSYILRILEQEEQSFKKTITQGSEILAEIIAGAKEEGRTDLSGRAVFRLHDTYGFPFDLTREIAAESGLAVDEPGFKEEMAKQKKRSKEATAKNAGSAWEAKTLPKTLTGLEPTTFTGYEKLQENSRVELLVESNEDELTVVDSVGAGVEFILAVASTPFYAESGGQVGDRGSFSGAGFVGHISRTDKTEEGVYLHHAKLDEGHLQVGADLVLTVDRDYRRATMGNHSATHLLHKALRTELGDHVTQAGSYVGPDRLRFDFHYGQALTGEQIERVEQAVNEAVLSDYRVETAVMSPEEAKQTGALALFDEKYGDRVRVVNMGGESIEFCGGTHVSHTAQIGLFKIVSEGSVASGIRRIEAVTGKAALLLVKQEEKLLQALADRLKTTVKELPDRLDHTLQELKAKEKALADIEKEKAAAATGDIANLAIQLGDIKVLCAEVDIPDAKLLRETADSLRDRLQPAVVVLAAKSGAKVLFAALAGKEAVAAGIHCGNIVRAAAQAAGGGGGGRPDMAQAGGKNVAKIKEALAAAEAEIKAQLG